MKNFITLLALFLVSSLFAQPEPGDVFREYIWNNGGNFLRVGGEVGYGGDYIYHNTNIDLVDATKIEIIIEKIMCHAGTYELEIEINDKGWILAPEPENIHLPQINYQYHIYPVIPIPISTLNQGFNNKFRMKVNPNHPWDWPQNLIYGVHFRVYYDPAKKTHPTGHISSLTSGSTLSESVQLKSTVSANGSSIKTVQYIAKYEDINYEGDGNYRQWHYHYLYGAFKHNIGNSSSSPYLVNWNTTWVPDQLYPFEIAARITDYSGMIYFTEPVSNLQFDRPETSIALVKPYDISESFVTSRPDRKEKFYIRSDVDRILAAQMVWTSWSPGHAHGIYVNGNHVLENEGPLHKYYFHRINLSSMAVFKEHENNMTFGRTEAGHHGMEVQWPGIMFLLQVDFSNTAKTAPLSPDSVSVVIEDTGIRIDWQDNADNEKGFVIERKSEGSSYQVINKQSWVERCFFLDEDYNNSTKYIYRVSAFNEYGASSSAEIPITTPAKKAFVDFSHPSHYSIGDNWINYKAGFYYLYDYKGVNRDPGVLKPIYNRPYTSTYTGNSYAYDSSNEITQSIYIKTRNMKSTNVDALNFGLLSVVGDELYFDSSDSSFVAISIIVSESAKTWEMRCYNKNSDLDYEIADSASNTFTPDPALWYRLNISWKKTDNDSLTYNASLDEYEDGALFLLRAGVLKLSGTISNTSICADDSIFAAIVGNDQAGIDAVDNFLVYDIPATATTIDGNKLFNNSPDQFALFQNYPNPFNPTTMITYELRIASDIELSIYNLLGQKVTTLVTEKQPPGNYQVEWDASSYSSGLYFYILKFDNNKIEVKKMLFVK